MPVLEWFYPIDHRRLWKDAYNEAYPSGKSLKESYKAVWEVNTLSAVLVLAMNASLFFSLITGESSDLYWSSTPYTSLTWWTMVMGGVIVVINFVHLNCLLVVHGVYSAVDDDNFRAIVSARGPTGRLAMIPDYLVVCSMYGMAMWWCMLLLVHVRNIVGSAIIIGLLLAIVTFLVSYSSYAARIIYHSGAHKPESIFQDTAPAHLPQTHEALGEAIMRLGPGRQASNDGTDQHRFPDSKGPREHRGLDDAPVMKFTPMESRLQCSIHEVEVSR